MNHHLHTIGRVDTQRCPGCGAAKETVLHYVLQLQSELRARRVFLGLLGRNGQWLDYLLSTADGTARLFKFVNATRRLHHTFGDLKTEDRGAVDGRKQSLIAQFGRAAV